MNWYLQFMNEVNLIDTRMSDNNCGLGLDSSS